MFAELRMRSTIYTIMNLEHKKISFQRFYFKKYFEIRLRCNNLSYLKHNNVDQIKQNHFKEMYITCRMQTHPKLCSLVLNEPDKIDFYSTQQKKI